MPKFLADFQLKYPDLTIQIAETTTSTIKKGIQEGKIDIGILVTPLNDNLVEIPLYYEELFLYSNVWEEDGAKLKSTLDPSKLWLLEEGHCLSSQVNSICNLPTGPLRGTKMTYQTGSMETIVRLADQGFGQTIIPQMFVEYLDPKLKEKVYTLPEPKPVREVALVHNRSYSRKAIIKALELEILAHIPDSWKQAAERAIIPI
jgi:LysR family hydrogen peroxide-inducible transcriptional activator